MSQPSWVSYFPFSIFLINERRILLTTKRSQNLLRARRSPANKTKMDQMYNPLVLYKFLPKKPNNDKLLFHNMSSPFFCWTLSIVISATKAVTISFLFVSMDILALRCPVSTFNCDTLSNPRHTWWSTLYMFIIPAGTPSSYLPLSNLQVYLFDFSSAIFTSHHSSTLIFLLQLHSLWTWCVCKLPTLRFISSEPYSSPVKVFLQLHQYFTLTEDTETLLLRLLFQAWPNSFSW